MQAWFQLFVTRFQQLSLTCRNYNFSGVLHTTSLYVIYLASLVYVVQRWRACIEPIPLPDTILFISSEPFHDHFRTLTRTILFFLLVRVVHSLCLAYPLGSSWWELFPAQRSLNRSSNSLHLLRECKELEIGHKWYIVLTVKKIIPTEILCICHSNLY